jgi:hypothetical protein
MRCTPVECSSSFSLASVMRDGACSAIGCGGAFSRRGHVPQPTVPTSTAPNTLLLNDHILTRAGRRGEPPPNSGGGFLRLWVRLHHASWRETTVLVVTDGAAHIN